MLRIFLIGIGIIVALWAIFFIFSFRHYPVTMGISFNQYQAASLGLDWKETYLAMLSELKPPVIRIAAMWSEVEEKKDTFNFEPVDFMMNEAAAHSTKVLLVIGQKAPRWPECHIPSWVKGETEDKRLDYLLRYVEKVIKRYQNHQSLELWQIENEPFIQFTFGECDGFDKQAIFSELTLVRKLDPEHKIVITDSGELSTWHQASRVGDIFGSTLYRIVRNPIFGMKSGIKWSYDWVPAGFYKLKARFWGRGYDDFFIAELQAEPWFVDSSPFDTPIAIQEETMNPTRLKKHLDYVRRVGASRAYLWGVEWWYWMKVKQGDARYWQIVNNEIKKFRFSY